MAYLSIPETAERIGVSRQAVYDMIKREELKTVFIAGHQVVSARVADRIKAERAAKTNGKEK